MTELSGLLKEETKENHAMSQRLILLQLACISAWIDAFKPVLR
jgi:hypothetical protein